MRDELPKRTLIIVRLYTSTHPGLTVTKLLLIISVINRHSQLYAKRNSPTNCLDVECREDVNTSKCKNMMHENYFHREC